MIGVAQDLRGLWLVRRMAVMNYDWRDFGFVWFGIGAAYDCYDLGLVWIMICVVYGWCDLGRSWIMICVI